MLFIIILFIILRFPNLFEPLWYLDEGIYLSIGQSLGYGELLYEGAKDNKTPLIYYLAYFTQANVMVYRLVFVALCFLTVYIFYKLTHLYFSNKKQAFIASIVFTFLTASPTLEGNIMNAELLFLLPCVTAFYILFKQEFIDNEFNKIKYIQAGIFYALAFLIKVPGVIDIVVFPLLWIFYKDKQIFNKLMYLATGFALPILFTVVYFLILGNFGHFINAAFFDNEQYISVWKPNPIYGIDSLRDRTITYIAILAFLGLLRNKIDKRDMIVYILLFSTLYASILSGRPYTHYLIQLLPALSLAIASIFKNKEINNIIVLSYIIALVLVIDNYKYIKYPFVSYYNNFIKYALGTSTKEDYYNRFPGPVNRNYAIAEYLKKNTKKNDLVYVMADEPFIYVLSSRNFPGKYTSWFQITEQNAKKETLDMLNKQKPKYIVGIRELRHHEGLETFVYSKYHEETQISDAVIYRFNEVVEDKVGE